MEHLTYLAVLVGCVVGTLPLEFAFRARVYRRWRRTLAAIVPVAAVFIAWDYLAAIAGWWSFDPSRLIGVWFGALPLEELLFFVVIPLCAILTLEAVRSLKPAWAGPLAEPEDAPRFHADAQPAASDTAASESAQGPGGPAADRSAGC